MLSLSVAVFHISSWCFVLCSVWIVIFIVIIIVLCSPSAVLLSSFRWNILVSMHHNPNNNKINKPTVIAFFRHYSSYILLVHAFRHHNHLEHYFICSDARTFHLLSMQTNNFQNYSNQTGWLTNGYQFIFIHLIDWRFFLIQFSPKNTWPNFWRWNTMKNAISSWKNWMPWCYQHK